MTILSLETSFFPVIDIFVSSILYYLKLFILTFYLQKSLFWQSNDFDSIFIFVDAN